jgi:hypothetical protein
MLQKSTSPVNKKHRFWLELLKVLAIFLIVVAVIAVVGYFAIKNFLNFDFFAFKSVLEKMQNEPTQEQMVSDPFTDEFTSSSFAKLLNSSSVYAQNTDGEYEFSKQNFSSSELNTTNVILTGKELASMLSVFFQADKNDWIFGSSETQLLSANFSNLDDDVAQIEIIFSLSLSDLKSSLEGDALSQIIADMLPDKIYFTSTFSIQLSNGVATITGDETVIVNKLSTSDSNAFLNVLNLIFKENENLTFADTINNNFVNYVWGENGFLNSFSTRTTSSFLKQNGEVCLSVVQA